MSFFIISRHYWIVAGSTTQVFSSEAHAYISVADATYVAWLAKGGNPTRIGSENDLWDTLIVQVPDIADLVPAALDRHKDKILADWGGKDFGALFKVLRNMNNRIRVLEGQAPLTVPQTIAALKSLLT